MMEPVELPVRVAALKARLSEYLRAVRQGQPVVVYDRNTPVARLVPYLAAGEAISIRPALRPVHSTPLPAPAGTGIRSLDVLLEDRRSGR
jgi:prevent-host-death family protein